MFTLYIVYVAGYDCMERYKAFDNLEEAKKCADTCRKFNKGTIYVRKETYEDVYYA